MNKVYIVTVGYDYEGDSNSGVFDTIEAARKHKEEIVAQERYDSVYIEEWEFNTIKFTRYE